MENPTKLLLVDDETDLLEQAKIFLERKDERLNVVSVSSAKEGLNLLDEENFDVIVSDYQMPEMDGLEFLEEVRNERDSDIPFIMFTGKGREEVAIEALNLGADRYLQKGGSPKTQYQVLSQAIEQEVEHHRTEMSLRRKDELLEQIFEKAEEGFYIRDLSGRLTFVNDAFAEIHGYDPEELIGKDSQSLLTESSKKKLKGRDFEDLKERDLEIEIVTKESEKKTLRNAIFPLKDEKGDIRKVFGISVEITEEKKKEKELKTKEERYRRLFETAQDGMLILDVDTGVIKDANPYIQDILDYSKEELTGKKIWEIGSFRNFAKDKKKFEQLVEEGYVRYEDLPLESKYGEEVPVEFVSNTYEVGVKRVAQCNIRKISERKKAEEALEHLIKSISGVTGKDLFKSIVEELIEWFDVDAACVARLQDNGRSVSSLSMKLDDEWIDDYEYELDGTPCEEVTVRELEGCLYREGICEAFPEDEELKELEMEGYLGVPILDEEGEALGVIWAVSREKIRDIPSNWKKLLEIIASRASAEIKRRESKERYESLIDSMNDAIFIHDLKGNFLEVNQEAINRLGYTQDELLKMGPQDIDAPGYAGKVPDLVEKIKDKKTYIFKSVHLTKEGRKIPVEISSTLTFFDGKSAILSVARDISDRREREKEMNLLYRILSLGQETELDTTEILGRTVEMIPKAFQYPEMTTARIIFDSDEFKSSGYEKGQCNLQKDIIVEDKTRGSIEVYYTEEDGEEPFLEEEKDLIEAVADILGNIIDRKERKKKLRRSERKFRGIFETSPDPAFLLDEDGVVREVNQIAFEKLGYEKEEIVGKSIQELPFISEENRERLVDNFARRKKGEDISPYEIELVTKNEDVLHTEINASIFEKSALEGEVVIARDITERKRSEGRLNDEKRKIKELYQITPEIREIKDLQMLYELTIELANNILDFDVCTVEIEEDGDLVVKASTEKELVEEEYTMSVEEGIAGRTFRKKESELIRDVTQSERAKPTDESFRSSLSIPMGDMGVFQAHSYEEEKYDESDLELAELFVSYITSSIKQIESEKALKESEKRYRSLIENSIVGVGISDFDENIIFANERFAEMLGYNKTELEGKNISELTTEEEFYRITEKTEDRKKGESDVYETRVIKKDGDTIDIMLGATPYIDAEGEIKGAVAFIQDISERKKAQQREEFLHSLLRHDIRNKIQVIQGYLQLLDEDENLSEKGEEYIQSAEKGVKTSIDLIEKIRTLREANQEEIEEMDVKPVLNEAIDNLKDQMIDMELEVEMDSDEGFKVKAGPLLKEVFFNLIENSIRHSDGKKIRISSKEYSEEIVCIIEDDGKGIPNDEKEKILKKGYTSDKEKGTGLGLFLIQKLLEVYEGKIEVKDSELGGARFDVHLKKS